jgi:hypothetical protein
MPPSTWPIRLGGDLEPVGELHTLDILGRVVVAVEPTPATLFS